MQSAGGASRSANSPARIKYLVRITISKENYLKAVTLSRWLRVSAPAVTMAIKRLKRDSLIQVDNERVTGLTATGREIANRVLNGHHLIKCMLADEAEQLEHA